jgi:putative two-component system response regulator
MMAERKNIFIVDDNMANLAAGKNVLKERYKTYPIPSAEALIGLLDQVVPDMILLDVDMPGISGYDAIKRLKMEPRWADIPVIFLTAASDESSELEGLALGAVDYVTKPFSAPLLLQRVENHLQREDMRKQLLGWSANLEKIVAEKTKQVFELQNAVLASVVELVEFRDDVTGAHVARTQSYLRLLLDQLIKEGIYLDEMASWDMDYLIPSAQLHDVGKVGISDMILNKPGRLTTEEFEIMKTHVTIGVEVIQRIEGTTDNKAFLEHAEKIAESHHERWDGKGYPYGKTGFEIPLEGRLMAIADVYDALVSRRPYKEPFSVEQAQNIIEEGKGTQFDPALVDIFSQVAGAFANIVSNNAQDEKSSYPWGQERRAKERLPIANIA